MFRVNETVDDTYLIVREIGSGGTGVIFLAYHLRLEKYVVIKRIKDNFKNIVNVRAEVDILKRLHHKYLPQVYDFVQRGDEVYTVIDYIEGYNLEDYVQNGYYFSEAELVKWLKQLCEVLDYLHSQSPVILHSDIKPANIMINANGDVCLIDFNISLNNNDESKLSGLSFYYAAPEQVEKANAFYMHQDSSYLLLDGRMDIYSLGATFYYLMTGIQPTCKYSEIYPIEYMKLPYSQGLTHVVAKSMRINRDERFESAHAMGRALNNLRKYDLGYKIHQAIKYSSAVVYAVLLPVGILCIIAGNKQIREERLNSNYEQFIKTYNIGNSVDAISQGIHILNESDYKNILEENETVSIEIYHALGDCYFYLQDYDNASQYYGQAYQLTKKAEDEIYFRDYCIALVRADISNISEAERIIEEKKSVQSTSYGMSVVEAQIKYMEKKVEEAETLAGQIVDSFDAPDEDKAAAYIILSDIAYDKNDIVTEIYMREKTCELDNNIFNNRMLAQKYVEYGNTLGASSVLYYQKAAKVYEKITQTFYATADDRINMAIAYSLCNTPRLLQKGEEILKQLSETESDYRIDLNLAVIYMKQGEKNNANTYCRKALEKYQQDKDKSGTDYAILMDIKKQLGM